MFVVVVHDVNSGVGGFGMHLVVIDHMHPSAGVFVHTLVLLLHAKHSNAGVFGTYLTVVTDNMHSDLGVFGTYHVAIPDEVMCLVHTVLLSPVQECGTHTLVYKHAEVRVFCTYLTVVADEPNSGVGDGEDDMRYFTLRLTSRLEVQKQFQS